MLLYLIPGEITLANWPYSDISVKEFLISLTVGVVVSSVFINTFFIAPIIKKFHIDDLRDIEKIQVLEARILILGSLQKKLEKIIEQKYVDQEDILGFKAEYEKALQKERNRLEEYSKKYPKDFSSLITRVLFRHALVTERYALLELHRSKQVPEVVFKKIFMRLQSQINAVDEGESSIEKIKRLHPRETFVEKISKYTIDIFEKKLPPIHEAYYEARSYDIITEKALEALVSMGSVNIFTTSREYKNIVEMYEQFRQNAQNTRKEIKNKHRPQLRKVSSNLTETILKDYKNTTIIENGFEKKRILPEKVIDILLKE